MRLLVVILAVGVSSCGSASKVEVARATSPSGTMEVVLLETNGGATTSFGYLIQLRGVGRDGGQSVQAGSLYGAVRSDCAYGVDLLWTAPDTLSVAFDEAKTVDIPPTVLLGDRSVHLVVKPGTVNKTAPCGGMAYNLGKSDVR